MIELIIIIVSILLLLGTGGTAYYFSGEKKDNNKQNDKNKNNNGQNKNKDNKTPDTKEGEKQKTEEKQETKLNDKGLLGNKKNIKSSIKNSEKDFSNQQKSQNQQESSVQQRMQQINEAIKGGSGKKTKQGKKMEQKNNKVNKHNKGDDLDDSDVAATDDDKNNKVDDGTENLKKKDNLFQKAYNFIKTKKNVDIGNFMDALDEELKKNNNLNEDEREIIDHHMAEICKAIVIFREVNYIGLNSFFIYLFNKSAKTEKDPEVIANKLTDFIFSQENEEEKSFKEVEKCLKIKFDFKNDQLDKVECFTEEEIKELNNIVSEEKEVIRGYEKSIDYYSDKVIAEFFKKFKNSKEAEEIIKNKLFFSKVILFFYNRDYGEMKKFLFEHIGKQAKIDNSYELATFFLEKILNKNHDNNNLDKKKVSVLLEKKLKTSSIQDVNFRLPSENNYITNNKDDDIADAMEFCLNEIGKKKLDIMQKEYGNVYCIIEDFVRAIKCFQDKTKEELYCILLGDNYRSLAKEDIDYLFNLFFKNKLEDSFEKKVIHDLGDEIKRKIFFSKKNDSKLLSSVIENLENNFIKKIDNNPISGQNLNFNKSYLDFSLSDST